MFLNKNVSIHSILTFIWYITIFSGFFGSILGIGGVFLYRILFAIHLFLFIIYILANNKKLKTQQVNITSKKIMLFFWMWLLYGIMTTLWAINKADALREIIFLAKTALLITFSIYYTNSFKRVKYLNSIFLSAYLILCVIGLWETITGNHLSISVVNNYPSWRQNIPTAVFVNPNDFATYLTIYSPVIFYGHSLYSNKLIKALSVCGFCTGVFLIFMTNSRANIISLGIGIFAFILLSRFKVKVKLLAVSALLVMLSLIYNSNYLNLIYDNFIWAIESLEGQLVASEGSAYIRVNLIKNGLIMLKNNLFLGVGAGNIDVNMIHYSTVNYTGNITKMHNFWMELATAYGLVIFVYFLHVYKESLRALFYLYKKGKQNIYIGYSKALIISVIIFAVSSTSSSSIITSRYIWIFWGMNLSCINVFSKDHKRGSKA